MAEETSLIAERPAPATGQPYGEDHLPMGQKIAWGISGITDTVMGNAISLLALPIYNIALGVSPIWIGWAMALPRIFDAIIDPFIGNMSDNFRSPWGRRRPFIFIGAILAGLFSALIWMPPTMLSKNGLGYFFLISSIFYYLGFALFTIPNGALGYELTTDYHERTRVQAWKNYFASGIGLLMPWFWTLSISAGKYFGGATAGQHPEIIGVRYVGVMIGLIVMICALVPVFFCKERTETQAQSKIDILSALKMTLKNPSFLIIACVIMIILVGLFVVQPFAMYINLCYVCKGDTKFAADLSAYGGMIYGGLGLASVPLAVYLSTRWGKKNTMIVGLSVVILGCLSYWFLYDPKHPYWQLIPPFLTCPGMTCVWILSPSMMADICDVDELETGLRREGMFGAVFALVFKGGFASTTIIAGYMLEYAGYVTGAAMQTEATIFRMRALFVIVPAVFIAFAVFLTWLFPVTEQKAREVRALLNARKQAEKEKAVAQA